MDLEYQLKEILFKYIGSQMNHKTIACIKAEVTDFLKSHDIYEPFDVRSDVHGSIGIFKIEDDNG
jgi:hypothetical protein